jgi:hypothetical protein
MKSRPLKLVRSPFHNRNTKENFPTFMTLALSCILIYRFAVNDFNKNFLSNHSEFMLKLSAAYQSKTCPESDSELGRYRSSAPDLRLKEALVAPASECRCVGAVSCAVFVVSAPALIKLIKVFKAKLADYQLSSSIK